MADLRQTSLLAIGVGAVVTVASGTLPPSTATRPEATFTKDVAPVLYRHCVTCHRPGGAGPFPLLAYDDARPRAPLIADLTARRVMPPWLPEPGYGEFAGERRLTDAEIQVIRDWVAAGAPEGDPADLPEPPRWPDQWQLGPPDLTVEFPPYTTPSSGDDVYRNLVAAVPVTAARYVSAVEVLPGDPRVVHHGRMMIDTTASSRRLDAEDAEPGFDGMDLESDAVNPPGVFVGWTPGRMPAPPAPDLAWPLEPGTDVVLQLHIRPGGTSTVLRPRVGFHFAGGPPARTPALVMLGSYDIDIPAGAAGHPVTDTYELPVDVDVLSVYPHAHYLGKELQGFATLPDGSRRWLIRIPDWDFNWQDEYRFTNPVALPAGTVLTMAFTYDNSADNPQNPNTPPRRVVYGSRSIDEMADLVLQVVPRSPEDADALNRDLAWKGEIREIQYLANSAIGRGNALLDDGRAGEAIPAFQEALQLRADDPKALVGLARAFLRQDQPDVAVMIARRATAVTSRLDPYALDVLAEALGAAGDWAGAVQAAEDAREAAARTGDRALEAAIRQRLREYRRRR